MSVNDVSRIAKDDPRFTLQIVASLTYNSRAAAFDCNMFLMQVTHDDI
jgi:hypothetical protein